MRPPILAGPMPRNTKRRSKGSLDQLMGVGVGEAGGVGDAAGVGDWPGVGVCCGRGCSAWTASAPSVTTTKTKVVIANNRRATSRFNQHASFIRERSFRENVI